MKKIKVRLTVGDNQVQVTGTVLMTKREYESYKLLATINKELEEIWKQIDYVPHDFILLRAAKVKNKKKE